jgi:cytochrome c oxidase subunit IV
MQSPAQSRFPRIARREEHEGLDEAGYVKVAAFLAMVTAIEVGIYYINLPKALFIVILVSLAAVKFATVCALFMHLRFDGKLLTYIFCAGLTLIAIAGTIVVVTLRGMP